MRRAWQFSGRRGSRPYHPWQREIIGCSFDQIWAVIPPDDFQLWRMGRESMAEAPGAGLLRVAQGTRVDRHGAGRGLPLLLRQRRQGRKEGLLLPATGGHEGAGLRRAEVVHVLRREFPQQDCVSLRLSLPRNPGTAFPAGSARPAPRCGTGSGSRPNEIAIWGPGTAICASTRGRPR